jgi:hypothetical protein
MYLYKTFISLSNSVVVEMYTFNRASNVKEDGKLAATDQQQQPCALVTPYTSITRYSGKHK